ncbi:uncharacterized protein LOC127791083 isoform X9 [Diospyros lotus]|uniref:uncharacterized protein LOC127791083 isoform X9 n=1 Tax=Diospyros lotus TaxID=55363 RepID=UPI00224CEFC4|nr:uncharacterized protein LOC127791083 isoform X9 [Diospyros lotus]
MNTASNRRVLLLSRAAQRSYRRFCCEGVGHQHAELLLRIEEEAKGYVISKLGSASLSTLLQPKPILDNGKYVTFLGYRGNRFSMRAGTRNVLDHAKTFSHRVKEKVCDESELNSFPHVQTLRRIPKEELLRKVVMVRFDSTILLHEDLHQQSPSVSNALFTITYLYNAGAKIILVSNWSVKTNSKFFAAESVAEFLSVILQLKVVPAKLVGRMQSIVENEEKSDILLLENLSQFREELANCSKFAELLSAGIDIFVNDAFSQSHRILVSSVGITSFCHACVAGFHFEGALHQLKQLVVSNKKPYLAIIGGSNLLEKAAALHFLASRCDGLVFVGMMAFQIMHVQGLPVPMKLVEPAANEEALNIIQAAKFRSIPILFPEDFWCMSGRRENQVELFPAHCIPDGWVPVDIGPKSLGKISSFLSRSKAYPFEIDWSATYRNPARPLVVDIGSGNGLFLLEMARRRKDLNFLGLEINEKLVSHCLSCVQQSGMRNGYFIATNATSTFRSIISSYPGKLVLVSIQCPDPDFNKPQHCWSMLQRPLIEAIADLLASDGKVFLQSDIEGVAMRMKEQFLRHGKGKLVVMQDHSDNNIGQGGWLKENPFGMHSDWEQHVIDRGAPMYRLILFKSTVSG